MIRAEKSSSLQRCGSHYRSDGKQFDHGGEERINSQGEQGGTTRQGPRDDVTASEVAAYAFCAKAWHLERARGAVPSAAGRARRLRGVERHRAHGSRVRTLGTHGRALAWGGAVLLALALLLAVAAVALRR